MTFEELTALNDPCSVCPLCDTEYCPHCLEYEPPCAFAEGDIDKWIVYVKETNRRLDEIEDRKIREKKRRAEIARKKANAKKRMLLYCQKELDAVKELEHNYKKLKSLSDYAESYASATNFANEIFGYKERVTVRPEIKVELEELKNKIVSAKKAYEERRKEFCSLNRELKNEEL